jgi:hypothetical protein
MYFYFVNQEFTLSDPAYCSESTSTIDFDYNNLAKNKDYLNRLNFLTLHFNQSNPISSFSAYLSSFSSDEKNEISDKLTTNPKMRLLLVDNSLKNIFKGYFLNKNKKIDELIERLTELSRFIATTVNVPLFYATDEKSKEIHKELIECKNEMVDIEFIIKNDFFQNINKNFNETTKALYERIRCNMIY